MFGLPFQTDEASKMRIVGTSRSSSAAIYGTYISILMPNYNSVGFASHRACVLARCPSIDQDYTEVDLQIAYAQRSKCRVG